MKKTVILFLCVPLFALAADFKTNALHVKGAPAWVKKAKVQKVTDKIQSKLEWKIRRVPVIWHRSANSYSRAQSLGPLAAAVTVKSSQGAVVHMGPLVDAEDYEMILGHELVHVVFHQKYKGSIPDWLEEGFANFLSRKNKVDKDWLRKQKLPADVTTLGHPYKASSVDVRLHYKISQALVEMLDEKCDLSQLLRLSVRKNLETYIRNTCEIQDINQSFRQWLQPAQRKVQSVGKVVHTESFAGQNLVLEEVVKGLQVPWGFEFLDSQTILINEKNGTLSLYQMADGKKQPLAWAPPGLVEKGQGGSLDIKKHPRYPKVPWIYLTYVARGNKELTTHLGRFQIKGDKVVQWQKLLMTRAETDTSRHFGSRIAFDKQGFLYFSVGDRGHRPNGQDLNTHAGSILRLKDDGSIPPDNPFVGQKNARPEIWSYGHRNPQGLVYDPVTGALWAIEHGPRGGDEINLIEKGKNYGWPVISYGKEYWGPISVGESTQKPGMEQPVHYYVPSIAPCGMDIYRGDLFPKWQGHLLAGALKLTHLNKITLNNKKFVREDRLLQKLSERIRQVKVGPEGAIYLSTDSGGIYRLRPKA